MASADKAAIVDATHRLGALTIVAWLFYLHASECDLANTVLLSIAPLSHPVRRYAIRKCFVSEVH
jgi:hypothetical protein